MTRFADELTSEAVSKMNDEQIQSELDARYDMQERIGDKMLRLYASIIGEDPDDLLDDGFDFAEMGGRCESFVLSTNVMAHNNAMCTLDQAFQLIINAQIMDKAYREEVKLINESKAREPRP
jgi:hypothetical protein